MPQLVEAPVPRCGWEDLNLGLQILNSYFDRLHF